MILYGEMIFGQASQNRERKCCFSSMTNGWAPVSLRTKRQRVWNTNKPNEQRYWNHSERSFAVRDTPNMQDCFEYSSNQNYRTSRNGCNRTMLMTMIIINDNI